MNRTFGQLRVGLNGISDAYSDMMEKVREIPNAVSLKPEDVHGYRDIVGILLEKFDDLSDLDERHLEKHERKALQMFKEFEKEQKRSAGGRLPVFS